MECADELRMFVEAGFDLGSGDGSKALASRVVGCEKLLGAMKQGWVGGSAVVTEVDVAVPAA
jgi:hypothetical protein